MSSQLLATYRIVHQYVLFGVSYLILSLKPTMFLKVIIIINDNGLRVSLLDSKHFAHSADAFYKGINFFLRVV